MRPWVAVGFASLCLLSGSTWLGDVFFAASWPGLLRLCFHDCVVFVALVAWGCARRTRWAGRRLWEVGGWLALLFAGPVLMAAGAGGHLGRSLETLALGLVAAFTVFLRGQRDDRAMGRLLPAVCAVAGLGLVVPFAWPGSALGVGWLAALAVAGCGYAFAGIRLHGLMREVPVAWAPASGAAVAAALAGLGWIALEPGRVALDWRIMGFEIGWGLLVDLPLVLLTVWLLREMEPVGFSSRWVMIPTVTLLGSIAAERPEVGWIGWLGLGLAVACSLALVREPVS